VNHADVQGFLPDYLEGDLDLTRRALVDSHLDRCGDCQAELREMRDTIDLLRSMPDIEPPSDLGARIIRQVRIQAAQPSLGERVRAFLAAPRFVVPATAMATLAAVALVSGGSLQLPLPGTGASPAAEKAMQVAAAPSADRPAPSRHDLGELRAQVIGDVVARRSAPGDAALQPAPLQGPIAASQPIGEAKPLVEPKTPAQREAYRLQLLDAPLRLMIDRPAMATDWYFQKRLAEQEIWLPELAKRASETGLLPDVEASLRAAEDPQSSALADALLEAAAATGQEGSSIDAQ